MSYQQKLEKKFAQKEMTFQVVIIFNKKIFTRKSIFIDVFSM